VVDTPFINDGADESLRKTVSLLNKIEAKTGATTITGPVTVSNEVEVKNDSGNPVPVKVKDSAGADVSYITAGTAGTPSPNVLSVQGISGGVSLPISGTVTANVQPQQSDDTDANIKFIPIGYASVDGDGQLDQWTAVDQSSPLPVYFPANYPIPAGTNSIGAVTALDLGAKADAVATTDTGTFSVIALIKRGLQNWTSLLAKIPALVSGRIPVDGSGVTQPVSGTITAAQATAANLNATVVGSGSFTAAQATAANLNATVVQGTATNLKTQAEVYQGGSAVGSSNQLFVKTNTTYGGNAPIVVPGFYQSGLNNYLGVSDGSGLPIRPANSTTFAVTGTFWQATQPISGTVTATQATASSLKAQSQILNSAGSLITYAESGTYGNPSVDVISVQNPQGTSPAITTFTSTTASSTLVSATTARKTLTIYNSGAGDLYISPTATCTTTNFQVKLASGDYWECPAQQVTLGHTAVYGTAGTAYVTTIS